MTLKHPLLAVFVLCAFALAAAPARGDQRVVCNVEDAQAGASFDQYGRSAAEIVFVTFTTMFAILGVIAFAIGVSIYGF